MLNLYALFTPKKVLHKVMGIIQMQPDEKEFSFSIYVYGSGCFVGYTHPLWVNLLEFEKKSNLGGYN
jgi:hypothetical protein